MIDETKLMKKNILYIIICNTIIIMRYYEGENTLIKYGQWIHHSSWVKA